MVGRGVVTSRGAGLRITTVAGSITTAIGRGARAVSFTDTEAGGARRSSRSCSTSRLATTSAGIRSRTTSTIRARETIGITTAVIVIRITVVAATTRGAETTGRIIRTITSSGAA